MEAGKRRLSTAESTEVGLPFWGGEQALSVCVTRRDFEATTERLRRRLWSPLQRLGDEAFLHWADRCGLVLHRVMPGHLLDTCSQAHIIIRPLACWTSGVYRACIRLGTLRAACRLEVSLPQRSLPIYAWQGTMPACHQRVCSMLHAHGAALLTCFGVLRCRPDPADVRLAGAGCPDGPLQIGDRFAPAARRVTQVVLVGGATRMPQVRELVGRVTGLPLQAR